MNRAWSQAVYRGSEGGDKLYKDMVEISVFARYEWLENGLKEGAHYSAGRAGINLADWVISGKTMREISLVPTGRARGQRDSRLLPTHTPLCQEHSYFLHLTNVSLFCPANKPQLT